MDVHEYLEKLESGEIHGHSFWMDGAAVLCEETVKFYCDDRSFFVRLKDGRIVHEAFESLEKAQLRFDLIYEWVTK